MKLSLKNKILQELRETIIENVKKEKKFDSQTSKNFVGILDELLKNVDTNLEEGKTFDEIRRTITDFLTKKGAEL